MLVSYYKELARGCKMKFSLKKPCVDCPFLEGSSTNCTLSEGRLEEIKHDILYNDMSFTCHKTLDKPSREQQHCAGALAYLEVRNRPNQIMRIAERIGLYDKNKIEIPKNLID